MHYLHFLYGMFCSSASCTSTPSPLLHYLLPSDALPQPPGCFDREEDAARAYDKMMLWIEMHSSGATKAGITNFDVSQYAEDLPWLAGITQVREGACYWAA